MQCKRNIRTNEESARSSMAKEKRIVELLILYLLFCPVFIWSQSKCISMTVKEKDNDRIKINFKNECKETFIMYKYDLTEQNSLNRAYDIDSITLSVKGKYTVKNMTYGISDYSAPHFNDVKDHFFAIQPDEMLEVTMPVTVFFEKDREKYKNLKHYYLVKDAYRKSMVSFRLVYNGRVVKENILNSDEFNIYDGIVTSNSIELYLK